MSKKCCIFVYFGSILVLLSFCVHMLVPFWFYFGSILVPFWFHFGSNLVPLFHFGFIFVPILIHFGSILVPCWFHVGSILVLAGDARGRWGRARALGTRAGAGDTRGRHSFMRL